MQSDGSVHYISKPDLRNPDVICGLTGWVDGGDVATGGIKYLISQFDADEFASIPASRYHVYQAPGIEAARPMLQMTEGLISEARFPRNQFFCAYNPVSDRDVILFLGTEPSLYWEEYANEVVALARELHAHRLYTIGGVLDETPHTKEPRVSCSCTSPELRDELREYAVGFSNYGGPATFNSMLLYTCRQQHLEAVNFSVRVTYYPDYNIAIDYYPKSLKAILVRLNRLAHLKLNFDDLDASIRELDGKLDFMRKQNPQFDSYVAELERSYTEMPYQEPLDFSADEAVRFAEEFLRENKGHRER